MIALVIDRHLGRLSMTHWARAALGHILITVVAMIDDGRFDFHL